MSYLEPAELPVYPPEPKQETAADEVLRLTQESRRHSQRALFWIKMALVGAIVSAFAQLAGCYLRHFK